MSANDACILAHAHDPCIIENDPYISANEYSDSSSVAQVAAAIAAYQIKCVAQMNTPRHTCNYGAHI